LAFYDKVVPMIDLQLGLGFVYGGWGLEAGLRTSRLPREATVVDGKELVRLEYGLLLYVQVETGIHL
jgi:hypothetical protein